LNGTRNSLIGGNLILISLFLLVVMENDNFSQFRNVFYVNEAIA